MAEPAAEGTNETAAFLLRGCRDLRFRGKARVARGALLFSRIRDLRPGTILPLERLVGEPFELVAGGVALARGDLVARQDGLVLRITALGGDDEER